MGILRRQSRHRCVMQCRYSNHEQGQIYGHKCESNIKRVHLFNGCFPVFYFDRIFTVGYKDDFAGPSLLGCEVLALSLNAYDERVDRWKRDLSDSQQMIEWDTHGLPSRQMVLKYRFWRGWTHGVVRWE